MSLFNLFQLLSVIRKGIKKKRRKTQNSYWISVIKRIQNKEKN